jgi:hypothetical protein
LLSANPRRFLSKAGQETPAFFPFPPLNLNSKVDRERTRVFLVARYVTIPQLNSAEIETGKDRAMSRLEKTLVGQLNFGIQA